MGEVGLVNKQKIIRFTTIVHNLATLPGQITSRNRNVLAIMTKNLAINIRFVVIKANLEYPIRFFVHFSKTLTSKW